MRTSSTTIYGDNIFGGSGGQLTLAVREADAGYASTFEIGVQVA